MEGKGVGLELKDNLNQTDAFNFVKFLNWAKFTKPKKKVVKKKIV